MNQTKAKELTTISRSIMLKLFSASLLGIIQRMKDNYVLSMAPEMGQATQNISEDAVLISALLKNLVEHGSPAEVVFIDQSGQRISLKTDKNLTENDLVNLILDNQTDL